MKVLVLVTALCCAKVLAEDSPYVQQGIVPDIIDAPPAGELQVNFANNLKASYGNELTPTQVKDQPVFSWSGTSGDLFTVFMVDPDAPSRQNASLRCYLHFAVANVPQNDVAHGTILAPYMGSAPPKDSGLHRYTLLVYKQPGFIQTSAITDRRKFSVRDYASKNELGAPVAGNFFLAQFETAGSGGESVIGSAMYVTGVTVVGLYLSWNCS
ncbi:protein D3-like [Thrips palmi]|uniref:Protein D3-like n=1 Tax=Thrips palmi TaxID=161013 RepID=A0A6P8YYM7_THRPL|nr:protein D3-like [Thrips palmi]